MVEKHIKSLLYDHDCVIIPEFGGLITRYVSARIHPVKHTLTPPSKKVAFNEKLTLNDGLLISTIAYKNSISKEEAQRLVAEFVQKAKSRLNAENRFELQDIGVFNYNAERRLEFEYVEGDNFLEDSFGLPDLVARPLRIEEPAVLRTLLKERQQEAVYTRQPLRSRMKRMYGAVAGLVICGLSASAIYLLSLQTEYNLSSLNPISLLDGNHTAPESTVKRYASDYVPFTEDERLAAYDDILPSYNIHDVVTEPEKPAVVEASVASKAEPKEVVKEEVKEVVAVKEAKPAVKEQPVAKEAKAKQPLLTIKDKTGRFFVIVGGYSTMENAEARQNAIRKIGHDAKVILPAPGSKLFRVSVADFDTWEEAKSSLNKYRKPFGETIWVLNY